MDSIRQKLTGGIRLEADGTHCLVRSISERQSKLERLLFRRYPDQEWGTFFRFGYRETAWGLLVTMVDLIPPNADDFDPASPLVEFSPAYIDRALKSFGADGLAVGFIHSHPEDCRPWPSFSDDDMDRYLAGEFEMFSDGRPYVSLIASRDREGIKSFSGRAYVRGRWIPVATWVDAGAAVIKRAHSNLFPLGKSLRPDGSTERLAQLLGGGGVTRLAQATVGVIGCSGLGSPAVHVLARAGIGRFVLVDRGRFKASNLERNHASRATDLVGAPPPKTELLRRLIHEIRPETEVVCFQGDVFDPNVMDALVMCDVVVGATDSTYARAAQGDLTTFYLVPVLDLAVQMRASDGVLTDQVGDIGRYAPGSSCPWCRGRVSAAAIRAETATEEERTIARMGADAAVALGQGGEQYWIGEKPQELTVGYMTTVVAAMGAGYVQNWLIGSAVVPHERFQFDLGRPNFGFAPDSCTKQTGCSCNDRVGYADQGSQFFSVSQPEHFRCPDEAVVHTG